MNVKVFSGIMMTLLLIGLLTLTFNIQPVRTESATIIVPEDCPTIQGAINNAKEGDRISVLSGTYYENVVVNKSVSLIGENKDTTKVSGSSVGAVVNITANNVKVSGFGVSNGTYGIFLESSSDSIIHGNDVQNVSGNGIILYSGDNCTVKRNRLNFIGSSGIFLGLSQRCTIGENNITYSSNGVRVYHSNDSSVFGNKAINNTGVGIWLMHAHNSWLTENTAANNKYGILLDWSGQSTLQNNTMVENTYNLWINGWTLAEHLNDIDVSNKVNGKPVYYLINQHNLFINPSTFPEIGYLAVVNSSDVVVQNLDMSSNGQGVLFAYTTNSLLENGDFRRNIKGIDAVGSCNLQIHRNTAILNDEVAIDIRKSSNVLIRRNNFSSVHICMHLLLSSHISASENYVRDAYAGFYFRESSNCTLEANIIGNTGTGIHMYNGSFNRVHGNTVMDNEIGIIIMHAGANVILHNNFVNNTYQTSIYNPNVWDDGYPSGGNYWSDYSTRYPDAKDECQGENQDIPGSDGIWDSPYWISPVELWKDRYPLVEPWTPIPRTIDELKIEIEEIGAEGEIDNQGIVKSLIAKLNVAQKLVDKGKVDEAKSILEEDFIPQVENLTDIHITPEAAEILIESAEYIISNL